MPDQTDSQSANGDTPAKEKAEMYCQSAVFGFKPKKP